MRWEQLQTFYILISQGSIASAAKLLNVHPTTVSRHLAELEKQIGARLLKKKDGRYIATTDGESIYNRANQMAKEAWLIERFSENQSDEISGTVRITSIESFVSCCLVGRMRRLRKKYPALSLEFICNDENLSFNKRETDLAIRLKKPTMVNIVTRKLGNIGFALYGKSNTKRFNKPDLADIKDWITYDDDYLHLPEAKWLSSKMKKTEPIIKSSNASVLIAAISSGLGVGVLPCYRGDTEPSLVRLGPTRPVISREAWLLIHTDYRSNPKTCCVIDWVSEVFSKDKNKISGEH